MISLNAFVRAIHDAIMQAHDSLMKSDIGILDEFFTEVPRKGAEGAAGEKTLVPKNVLVEYPVLTAAGKVETAEIHVPLITLVPLSIAQIERATLTVDFDLEVNNGELQMNFSKQSSGGLNKMELTIAPHETSEGLKLLVEGYEAILKRQMP